MDKRMFQASGCDALKVNTTPQEAQCNVQIFRPTMKQCGYKSLKSPNCLNYYDGLFSTSTEMKEEFPEDECPQSSTAASFINKSSINSNIVFENEELSKVPETQEIKHEVSEEALTFIKTEGLHDEQDMFIAKTEMSDEYRILSRAGGTNVLYKVQTTSQEIQPTMCSGILKNGFNLLKHSNKRIIIEPPTLVGNEGNELHKSQYCDKYVNDDNMLAHVDDVHSHKKHKSELYHKSILKINAGRNVDKINYKCNYCKRIYKSKSALVSHLTNIHNTYGRIFQCWCGEQFPTPKHLYNHKTRQHDINIKRTNGAALKKEFQCDVCKKMFKSKSSLKLHILSIHFDYHKTFNCSCGKQFRTPRHLYKHKHRQHGASAKSTNNAELQCDICNKIFKSKDNLKQHTLRIHFDYDRALKCWCGKQFPTPIHLYHHEYNQHGANIKRTNGAALKKEFQCDVCKKMFKSKGSLKLHILSIHFDYHKTFDCWCGKQFRTPIHLHIHKYRHHSANIKSTNNAALKKDFQCDVCKKLFKSNGILKLHITNIHYDYGKKFKCWCGKQFRTPKYLYQHKAAQHGANVETVNDVAVAFKKEFQCDLCNKIFKSKGNLKQHILSIHFDYDKAFECWCGKQFRTPIHLNHHKKNQHGTNIKSTNDAVVKTEFQCDICTKMFKLKRHLKVHITRIHLNNCKTYKCRCGKRFLTQKYLHEHKCRQHGASAKCTNNVAIKTEFQCDICKKMFKSKDNLRKHINSIHYDYGKTFNCWCGKQFRAPRHLYSHKSRQHSINIKRTNGAALKKEFQCDVCKKMFKNKDSLRLHILNVHFDYHKTFDCWCGKQFRTPLYLYKHQKQQHDTNVKSTNNAALKKEFQCDVCKKLFIYKGTLKLHITNIHYDYGKTFNCWCGKQFRTPIYLYHHKAKQHDANVKTLNDVAFKKEFQCDLCNKIFKTKVNLEQHILRIHYDYGKTNKNCLDIYTSLYLHRT